MLFLAITSFSQDKNPISFYNLNPQVLNPAHVGDKGMITGFLTNRLQWSGLNDAPKFTALGVHGKIDSTFGIGINISNYVSGFIKEPSMRLAGSYKVLFTEDQSLMFGLSAGIMRATLNYEKDGISDYSDPTLENSYFGKVQFKSGFGLSYQNKALQLDFSVPDIYDASNMKYFQTIVVYVGYEIGIPKSKIAVTPGFLYRNSPLFLSQYDIMAKGVWDDLVWVQLGYRNTSGLIIGTGLKLKNFEIGYVYEANNAAVVNVLRGTHEISLYFIPPFVKGRGKEN